MKTIAVQLIDVTKIYTIHHEKPTLVERFVNGRNERFVSIDAVNLTIYKGEQVGITGPNGSGKTTLIKVITGITTPSLGSVHTVGKIVSLIDLEAGFHPDLTGYQNIFINGMLLGLTTKEIQHKLADIIAFADIHQFIDTPLFTYSQGMILRLGFAIAIHADPQILILDEGMAVGDANFSKKVLRTLTRLAKSNITMIHISHQIDYLRSICSVLLHMENGKITKVEPIRHVK